MKREPILILLVEDNIDHVLLTRESLKQSEVDFQVDVATNSDECLAKLRENSYDAMLLDYSLPKLDGLTLLDKINEGCYQTPVIMVTGQGDERIAVEAMKRGAYDYVIKSRNYLVALPLTIQKVIEKDAMLKEKVQLEQKIAASEKKYRELVENLNDFVYTLDRDGNITSVNKIAMEVLGYTAEELYQMNLFQLIPEPYKTQTLAGFQTILKKREVRNAQTVLRCKDGSDIHMEINSTAIIKDGEVVGARGVCRDITDRMKLEAQLRQSEKMAAIGTLASGVAHEFNNILAGIMGYASLAQMDDEYVPKLIETVLTLSQRGRQLTRSLSAFSQRSREDGDKYVNITDSLDSVIRMVKNEFDSLGIAIERNYKAIPKTCCNEGKLMQVFLNLLINAKDAIVREGRISIEIDCVDLPAPQGTPACASRADRSRQTGNTIYVKFTDTGCGIKEEHLEHIFEPFFTTKGSLGGGPIGSIGSGLGLSESYNIIKEHGGEIKVESEVGIGTTFTIQLPVREEKDLEIDREQTIPSFGEGKRVLVVDDESHVREILKAALHQKNCNVVTASSGEAALAEVQNGKFDYIFLDLMMPGEFDGLVTFDEIKKVDAEANIIITTGRLLDDIPEKYLSSAYNILTKPFSIEKIYENLNPSKSKA